MKYSEEIIAEVLAQTNIVEIIGEQVKLKKSGSRYVGLCPFHNERTPSFTVTESRQLYYCFGCHAGGDAITFMMDWHNYTFTEALKALADRAGITLPEESLSEEQKAQSLHRARLLEAYKQAATFYYYSLKSEKGRAGLDYLRGRGLTDETIRRFGLGYADKFGNSLYRMLKDKEFTDQELSDTGLFYFDEKKGAGDRFWNRVMFPIFDGHGRVIAFGGRVLGDGKPKYLNSPEGLLFNKRKNLYALNYARNTRDRTLILCEGYMDVITMHQNGFTNAVASLGTALTSEQCLLMKRFADEVLILYDSDEAGQNAALRAIPLLKEAGLSSRVVSLAPYKDPDEFLKNRDAETLKKTLLGADDAFLFEMMRLAGRYRRSEPAEWTEFQHEAAGMLAGIEDELERLNYLEAVCSRFNLPYDAMKRLTGRKAAQGTPAQNYRAPRSGRETGTSKEEGLLTSQKLMLKFLAEYPEAYTLTKGMIGAENFSDPLMRRIADVLYGQLEEGKVNEALLISAFPDAEDERRAAGVFHTEIPVRGSAELDRTFTDTVVKLLAAGNEQALEAASGGDMAAFEKYISGKKQIEAMMSGPPLHPGKGIWETQQDGQSS